MAPPLPPPSSFIITISVVVVFFLFFFSSLSLSQSLDNSSISCAPSSCGNITEISFPFYLSATGVSTSSSSITCGIPEYALKCDTSSQATITISDRPYKLKSLSLDDRLMVVVDADLLYNLATNRCSTLQNLSIPSSGVAPLAFPSPSIYLSFYTCPPKMSPYGKFVEQLKCDDGNGLYLVGNYDNLNMSEASRIGKNFSGAPVDCSYYRAPVLLTSLGSDFTWRASASPKENLLDALGKGFSLQWPEVPGCLGRNCTGCAFDSSSGQVFCLRGAANRSKHSRKMKKLKILIGTIVPGAFTITLMASLLKFRQQVKSMLNKYYFKSKTSRENDQNLVEFMNSYRSMVVNKYSYADIRKMTSDFKDKLGEGGFGNVYMGKLADGRPIAAKILKKSHDSGQDFINEVSTIGTIHHINVVRLLGFCWEGSRRALLYEFMPNGSLGDLINKGNIIHSLGWPKLLEIAIGIAHGLEYLYQGCHVRILHLDIKPQNVLLDENYNPKISDFGLAMTFSRMKSVASITDAKGTIGYIAPEMFLRNLGQVSHKSDVYSYGMLLLEMADDKKTNKGKVKVSETGYFPDWIYERLLLGNDINIGDSIEEEDSSIAKKIFMVGLWCIQMKPSDRPTMSKVVDMLVGSTELIEMPPKPYLFSPPRSEALQVFSLVENDSKELPLMSNST